MQNEFIKQKPHDQFLSTLVEYYYFIDIPIDFLSENPEYVIPFPRITFAFFFDHPFMVTNHTLKLSEKVDMVISRISTDKITMLPLSDRIKILGAHVKPYTLAHLSEGPINQLPWLIDTIDLFKQTAVTFRKSILECTNHIEMFEQVEKVFLDSLLTRNLQTITQAVDIIEDNAGDIKLSELADHFQLSDRALREQFHKYIGCAPKEFIRLVQLKKAIKHLSFTNESLTDIAYQNNYFDQAHFINSFKKITGKSPKALRKEMVNFRFLQF